MEDDFNTADAVSAIFELVKLANVNIHEASSAELVNGVLDRIKKLCGVFGIITEREKELLDEDIEKLIEERQAARKAKKILPERTKSVMSYRPEVFCLKIPEKV